MIVLNALEHIFNNLFVISILVSVVSGAKKIFSNTSQEEKENTTLSNKKSTICFQDYVKAAIIISALIVFVLGVIIIVIKYKRLYWTIFFLGVPVCLEQITGTYISLGIVGEVVRSKDNSQLSFREQAAIKTLAYVLWFCGIFHFWEEGIKHIYACSNIHISDMLIVLLFVTAFYLYIFFICSLLPELIFCTIKLLKKIYAIMPGKSALKRLEDFWVDKIDKPIVFKSLLIWQWETIKKWKILLRWIRYLLFPVTFIVDVIIMLINIMVSYISSEIGYFFLLIRLIKKTLNRILNWVLRLSDKRVVTISFRISLVLSLTCIVILNRYQTIFRIEESTDIFEFMASAIIIPVIFEWINSIKNN